MDINKENTKYLASLLSNCGATQDEINDLSFDDEVGFFESNRLADWFVSQINFGWRVWQAAKAHEAEKLKGCVLVPLNNTTIVAIERMVEQQVEASGITDDVFRLDGEKILNAAVEAQEPAND